MKNKNKLKLLKCLIPQFCKCMTMVRVRAKNSFQFFSLERLIVLQFAQPPKNLLKTFDFFLFLSNKIFFVSRTPSFSLLIEVNKSEKKKLNFLKFVLHYQKRIFCPFWFSTNFVQRPNHFFLSIIFIHL